MASHRTTRSTSTSVPALTNDGCDGVKSLPNRLVSALPQPTPSVALSLLSKTQRLYLRNGDPRPSASFVCGRQGPIRKSHQRWNTHMLELVVPCVFLLVLCDFSSLSPRRGGGQNLIPPFSTVLSVVDAANPLGTWIKSFRGMRQYKQRQGASHSDAVEPDEYSSVAANIESLSREPTIDDLTTKIIVTQVELSEAREQIEALLKNQSLTMQYVGELIQQNEAMSGWRNERDVAVAAIEESLGEVIMLKEEINVLEKSFQGQIQVLSTALEDSIQKHDTAMASAARLEEELETMRRAMLGSGYDEVEANLDVDGDVEVDANALSLLPLAQQIFHRRYSDMREQNRSFVQSIQEQAAEYERQLLIKDEQAKQLHATHADEIFAEIGRCDERIAQAQEMWLEQMTEAEEAMEIRLSEVTEDITKMFSDQISSLQEEHSATIKTLRYDLTHLQQKLTAEHLDEVTKMNESHQTSVQLFLERIETARNKVKTLHRENESLVQERDNLRQKIVQWETLFDKRSYCNVSHVYEDLVYGIDVLYNGTSVRLRKGHAWLIQTDAYHLSQASMEPYQPYLTFSHAYHVAKSVSTTLITRAHHLFTDFCAILSKQIAPYVKQVNDAVEPYFKEAEMQYQTHVQPIADNVIVPSYVKYLQPVTSLVADHVEIVRNHATSIFRRQYDSIVDHYTGQCRYTLTTLESFRLKRNLSIPNFFIESVSYSCLHPDLSIRAATLLFLLLLAIPLRFVLLEAALFIIFLPFEIMYFFCPWMFSDEDGEGSEEEVGNADDGEEETSTTLRNDKTTSSSKQNGKEMKNGNRQ